MLASDVIKSARRMVGTPWHHAGRKPGLEGGLDCMGLLIAVAEELDYPFTDIGNYSRHPGGGGGIIALLEQHGDPVPLTDIRESDVGVFWFDRSRKIDQHAGIFVNREGGHRGLGLIHTYTHVNKLAEHAFDKKWEKRLMAVFRWRGVQWQH